MINRREFIGAGIAAGAIGSAGFGNRASASGSGVTLGFVGDVLSDRDNPIESYEPTLEMLRSTDVLFGNAEGPYSDNPVQPPNAPVSLVPGADNLDVFADVGFDVLSLANNHSVDGGHQALLETIDRLRDQGVATCGAGTDLADARKPAIIESNGVKVAYLAYASVFPMGFQATPFTPGLVPMRARNVYRQALDSYYLPGTEPQVTTIPDEADQAAMVADIKATKEIADLVVTSFHWGDYLVPYHLTDHEIRTAHLCIDTGADIVAGHHHHVLRGMEWYKGKPIFYGLGHYAFDVRLDKWPKEITDSMTA